MKYIVTLNEKNYEIAVERGEAIVLNVTNAAVSAPVYVPAAPAAAPVAAAPAAPTADGEQILSPMPGTILNINVVVGQAVKRGQVLLVFEAMKMENDIVAPRDAIVAQVITTKGASIDTGDLLVVLS